LQHLNSKIARNRKFFERNTAYSAAMAGDYFKLNDSPNKSARTRILTREGVSHMEAAMFRLALEGAAPQR